MAKFTGYVRTNKIGSESFFEFEADDEATEEEIEELGKEAMFEKIEWSFKKVE